MRLGNERGPVIGILYQPVSGHGSTDGLPALHVHHFGSIRDSVSFTVLLATHIVCMQKTLRESIKKACNYTIPQQVYHPLVASWVILA